MKITTRPESLDQRLRSEAGRLNMSSSALVSELLDGALPLSNGRRRRFTGDIAADHFEAAIGSCLWLGRKAMMERVAIHFGEHGGAVEATIGCGPFRFPDDVPPVDDNEVIMWEGRGRGWTTAYRGGDRRDGGLGDGGPKNMDWWVWWYGVTVKTSGKWWRPALPTPVGQTS